MSEKRVFQKLDEMNVADSENNTALVGICNHLAEARTTRAGDLITIGAPAGTIQKIDCGEYIAVLCLINKADYDKR